MARNEEKQQGRLNRMILQREKDEQELKNPKRPKLFHLHTVKEIQKWLPSIKRDIDFNLKQSQVLCYSDDKISSLHQQVVKLEKEYKSFVRKIKQVDGSITNIPWTDRPYERKNISSETREFNKDFIPLRTPILDVEEEHPVTTEETIFPNWDGEKQDLPLEFNSATTLPYDCSISKAKPKMKEFKSQSDNFKKLAKIYSIDLNFTGCEVLESAPAETYATKNPSEEYIKDELQSTSLINDVNRCSSNMIWSGLDYSSSSDDDA